MNPIVFQISIERLENNVNPYSNSELQELQEAMNEMCSKIEHLGYIIWFYRALEIHSGNNCVFCNQKMLPE